MKRKRGKLKIEQITIHADPRDYYLLWFTGIPDDCDRGFVGKIHNSFNPDITVRIEIDDEWMIENRKRGVALYVEPPVASDCIIVSTKESFDRMYRQQKGLTSIWHEIGHYHTMKYFLDYLVGNQQEIRAKSIKSGIIPPAEYAADLFALYYGDREEVFEDFKTMIRARYKLIGYDDNARDGWNELRMRRDALKKLVSDDDIEKELCKVCGVRSIEDL